MKRERRQLTKAEVERMTSRRPVVRRILVITKDNESKRKEKRRDG